MATDDFVNAVRAFVGSDREMESLRTSMVQAYDRWDKGAKALAAMVVPSDMDEGETICVWVSTGYREERLLSVKLVKMVTKTVGSGLKEPVYQVMFRGKPREKYKDDGTDRVTAADTGPEA